MNLIVCGTIIVTKVESNNWLSVVVALVKYASSTYAVVENFYCDQLDLAMDIGSNQKICFLIAWNSGSNLETHVESNKTLNVKQAVDDHANYLSSPNLRKIVNFDWYTMTVQDKKGEFIWEHCEKAWSRKDKPKKHGKKCSLEQISQQQECRKAYNWG